MDTYLLLVHRDGEYEWLGHVRQVYEALQHQGVFATDSLVDEPQMRSRPTIVPKIHMVEVDCCLRIHTVPGGKTLLELLGDALGVFPQHRIQGDIEGDFWSQ